MTARETKTLDRTPGPLTTLSRLALPALAGINQLPGIKRGGKDSFAGLAYARTGVEIERADVDAYAGVCGFPRKDTVPLPYPHLVAFPLHMAIMADRAFPYPAVGTVHLENSITSHRPIRVGQVVDVTVSVDRPRPHTRGVVLDFVAEIRADGEAVWESRSVYLRRGQGDPDAATGLTIEGAPEGRMPWRLAADVGRRYAAVSGDRNPIHLYPATARALGFPRQIAHGMWTKARAIAAIENQLPDAVRVDVAFKKPIFLPGTVAFADTITGRAHTFAVTNPKDGSPHLLGQVVGI